MPAQSNQLVSFQDLQDLIDNEGFVQNNPFTPSNLLADKLEVEDALVVLTINIADNQLVQRSLILKGGTPVDNPPTAPTSVVIDSFDQNSVTISWSGATDDFGIDFYYMYIQYDGTVPPVFIERIPGIFSTYTYTGLTPDTTYRFYVKAIDTIGQESPFSPYAEQTTASEPIPPPEITVTVIYDNADNVRVLVTAPSGDFLNWEIYVNSGGTVSPYDGWQYLDNVNSSWLLRGTTHPSLPATASSNWNSTGSETLIVHGYNARVENSFVSWSSGTYFRITSSSLGTTLPADVNIDLNARQYP